MMEGNASQSKKAVLLESKLKTLTTVVKHLASTFSDLPTESSVSITGSESGDVLQW